MTRRVLRLAVLALPPLLAGGLIASSLPPVRWWPLAPVGVALLSRCNAARTWRVRALNGLLVGVADFSLGCIWALQFTAFGYVALVGVQAIFVALASTLSPPGRGRVAGLAGALTIAEWARDSWPFGGLPIAGLALGQVTGPVVALARIGGPLLVVGGACLAGTGLEACAGDGLVNWSGARNWARCGHATGAVPGARPSSTALGGAAGAAGAAGDAGAAGVAGVAGVAGEQRRSGFAGGAVVLVLVVGATLLAAVAPDGAPVVRRESVVAVQGGGVRGLSALEVPAASVLGAQLAATETAPHSAGLVVWPEDSASLDAPLAGSAVERLLASVARRLRSTLVVGVTSPVGTGHFLNEASIWSPSGRFVASYVKVHPVPFGEYVPYRSLLSHFVSLDQVPRDEVAGHGSGMVQTPAGRLALLISYETFFAARGRSGVRAGGELLVVPTNTASYSGSQIPEQELAASQIQAISEGRDLVQAAQTGYSAIVDYDGNVLRRSPLASRDVLSSVVELREGSTLYERLGDLPVLVVALLAATGGWVLEWRERTGRGSRARV